MEMISNGELDWMAFMFFSFVLGAIFSVIAGSR